MSIDNLLENFVELNMSNYNQDDVESLQEWAFKAYDFMKELIEKSVDTGSE